MTLWPIMAAGDQRPLRFSRCNLVLYVGGKSGVIYSHRRNRSVVACPWQ